MFRKTLFAAALLGALVPAAASADSIVVRHGDLDLSSPDGRSRLNTRIKSAARRVCAVDYTRDLSAQLASNICFRKALASAEPQVMLAVAKSEQRLARTDSASIAVGS